jgi:hypothetical protein
MTTLRRQLHPEVRVVDARRGLVEYVASDETLDSFREVIRADGWRFDLFKKNAPFVDSHEYGTLEKLVGKVVDFSVAARRLVETVQWAVDVAENKLAQLGWKMTQAGYLKAVSVGFVPQTTVTSADTKAFKAQLRELGLQPDANVRTIYTRQQQIELSAVIIGANPNALQMTAKAYKAGVLSDADLGFLFREPASRGPDPTATKARLLAWAQAQEHEAFISQI